MGIVEVIKEFSRDIIKEKGFLLLQVFFNLLILLVGNLCILKCPVCKTAISGSIQEICGGPSSGKLEGKVFLDRDLSKYIPANKVNPGAPVKIVIDGVVGLHAHHTAHTVPKFRWCPVFVYGNGFGEIGIESRN